MSLLAEELLAIDGGGGELFLWGYGHWQGVQVPVDGPTPRNKSMAQIGIDWLLI